MVKCPNCSEDLIGKDSAKFCAQIGNPDIAIVETGECDFCDNCKEFFLTTEGIISAIGQIKNDIDSGSKNSIEKGIYC